MVAITDAKRFIELLWEIERQIDPSSCVFPDFNYWPILRFAINYRRKMNQTYRDGSVKPVTPKIAIRLLRNEVIDSLNPEQKTDWQQKATDQYGAHHFDALPQADVLYLNLGKRYLENYAGLLVNPFTDGLRLAAGDDIKSLTISSQRSVAGTDRPYLIEPTFHPSIQPCYPVRLILPRSWREYRLRQSVLRNVCKVNRLISKAGIDLQINPRDVLTRLEITSRQVHFWLQALAKVQPKVVILSSFTGLYYVCAAARQLGITVVDVQHGGMHRYHPLASNWSMVPVGGYELLPDIFWCWSRRSADYINFPRGTPHRAIVGGNPKLAIDHLLQEGRDIQEFRVSDRPNILVALQYGADDLVAPHLNEAIRQTKDRVKWHFRLHPAGWNRIDEAVSSLPVSRDELIHFSQGTLYMQLCQMDLVLTNASTIVHEAIEYGAKAAVCTQLGATVFADLIEDGRISYASSVKNIIQLIDDIINNSNGSCRSPRELGMLRVEENGRLLRKTLKELISEKD